MHGKQKTCKKRNKTNFLGQDFSYDMYWNEIAVFKNYCIVFFLCYGKDFKRFPCNS